jgi:diguanylate cyclase (GGDEF)-like protein
MRDLTRGRAGWSVRRRLFLLVLFPLVVLSLAVGVVAQDRRAESQAASAVEGRVEDLRALVGLQTALYSERAAVEIKVRSAAFGMSESLGAILLGISEPSTTFAGTDLALDIAAEGVDGFDVLLDRARIAQAVDLDIAIEAYEALDDRIVEAIVIEVDAMQRAGLGTADPELAAVLEQLEAAVISFSASTDQTTRLASSWFGAPEARTVALSELGLATAQFDQAIGRVDPSLLPTGLWSALVEREDPVSAAVLAVLAGESRPVSLDALEELPMILQVFQTSFDRNGALVVMVDEVAGDVELAASRIADDARRSYQVAVLLGGLAVVSSVVLSWQLARSIAEPMLAVAVRTRELLAGQLEAEPLPLVGPRELRDVAAAVNDVSANLDSLDDKLTALARADLDSEALSERLPGRLGETLTRSVDTLSASIADRADLQSRLAYQASHDALTGLANRAAVLDRITGALQRGPEHPVGLLFVDLDDFKRANDVFGHATGDLVLMEIGARLVAASRPSDLVARLGGDEFLVVVDEPVLEQLVRLAERLIDRIREPVATDRTGGLSVAASVGIAMSSGDDIDALDFLSRADAALYRAKGTDLRVAVFDDALQREVTLRTSIEQRLRGALANGDFEVHYQPVLAAETLEVEGVEALVRWTTEDAVGPDVFIPVAEASDLVVEIDRFVMAAATAEAARLIADGTAPNLRMAVNLSARHLLHADVVAHVREALQASGLAPNRLTIEVTETALIADLDRAALHLGALRALGVRSSVDDFGTGFTSISQLRRLPIDELKIDQSLVGQLPGDQTLVRVVSDLAEHFGMTTVAEGVETQEQADFLRQLGCTRLQGWLYARAMNPAALREWLTAPERLAHPSRVASTDSP